MPLGIAFCHASLPEATTTTSHALLGATVATSTQKTSPRGRAWASVGQCLHHLHAPSRSRHASPGALRRITGQILADCVRGRCPRSSLSFARDPEAKSTLRCPSAMTCSGRVASVDAPLSACASGDQKWAMKRAIVAIERKRRSGMHGRSSRIPA